MRSDWTRLDSADRLEGAFLDQGVPPLPGGGTQSLRVQSPPGGGPRAIGFRNDRVGPLDGAHEVSAALRMSDGAGCSMALVVGWEGVDLESTDGFQIVMTQAGVDRPLALRRGPGASGELLADGGSVAHGAWQHLLLQAALDRAGGQVVRLARSGSGDLAAPIWEELAFVTIPRHLVRAGGFVGFLLRTGQPGVDMLINHIRVASTLSTIED